MESIKTLFLLMFFSKSVLLTPIPVTIGDDWQQINIPETLDVITGGAAIFIDVSQLVNKPLNFEGAKELFRANTVEGLLITKQGKEVVIRSKGNSFTNEQTFIIVSGNEPIPTNIEIVSVKLKSNTELKEVRVFWENGSK